MASTPVPVTVESVRKAEGDVRKSPWGTIGVSPDTNSSFLNIMSEQLAEGLQTEENTKYYEVLQQGSPASPSSKEFDLDDLMAQADGTDCTNDETIAHMLQIQFNKEYDEDVKRLEKKYNGTSKVSVSLCNYMSSHTTSPQDDDSDSDEELEEELRKSKKPWDSFEAHEKAFPAMGGKGYVKVNNEMVTKHDITMNGRRNACRVMERLPPCIATGDAGSFDMKLSNQVYNNLKNYSKAEDQRRTRLHDKEEKATHDMAMDPKTRLLLYKLINGDILKKVHGIISTGKEAVILFAEGGGKVELEGGETIDVPEEVAVKVFKTSLNEFKTRDKYIKDDYRFRDRFSKQNPRKIIQLWSEKEKHNLTRMEKAGVPGPKAVLLKKHLLILSFIGEDGKAAPKLKEVNFPQDDDKVLLRSAYDQTVKGMRKLYVDCHLVHSDLSEYNILWHKETCYFIDVSQSVEPSHPNALEFLYRDCLNIITFFGKRHLENIHSAASLFSFVSGLQLQEGEGPSVLSQIRDFEKNVELLTFAKSEKSYPFDTVWEQGNLATSPPKKSTN